ncbi:MAG: hypothetical protein R6X33_07150 [Candidatus Brocadiia bacterium]
MRRGSAPSLGVSAVFVCLVLAVTPARCFAGWEVSVERNASFTLTYDGAPIAESNWPGWGTGWDFARARIRSAGQEGDLRRYEGRVPPADGVPRAVPLQVEVSSPRGSRLEYAITASPSEPLRDIVGFALAIDFTRSGNALGYNPSLTFRHADGTTETMDSPGRTGMKTLAGFTWHLPGEEGIDVEFAQPTPCSVEGSGEVRIWYVNEQAPAAPITTRIGINLPAGTEMSRSLREKFGPTETDNWVEGALDWNASPVDLSWLNHRPAGKHGFLQVDGDDFVFEDDTPARFWAGNIAAYAIFSDKETMPAQARRIARMGFNLMRIHHHDSTGWVSPTVIDKSLPHSRSLNAEAMDKLDYLIHCLKQEGVYVWLDLHVGREFKRGDDIPGFDDLDHDGDGKGGGKGFCYYNPRIEQLMKEFNQKYLTHVNPYTGLAYKDDPAIMGLLVTNENDLTNHFGNRMLGDKGNPFHNKIFTQRVRDYCERTGLPYGQTSRTWEAGPSKRYLNHEQSAWSERMTRHLRSLGARVPIVANQFWAGMGMWDLPALAESDFVDVHSYGGEEPFALGVNPRYASNFAIRISAAQIAGKPLSITEWNTPYSTTWRAASPMYISAMGALQGWDAPMLYNYSQHGFGPMSRTHTWTSYQDPGLMATMPAAALAFRQGHFRRADKTAVLRLTEDQVYNRKLTDTNMPALRTLAEQHRIAIALPDMESQPTGDVQVTDPERQFIPADADAVRSDTGEIARYWGEGVQLFDTPRTQGAQGFIGLEGGRALTQLADVQMDIETNFGVLVVSSLDERPVRQSERLMITAIGRAVAPGNRFPFYSEPLSGTLRIANQNDGMRLIPVDGTGQPKATVTPRRQDGAYEIDLSGDEGTHWFVLTASGSR